jgi:hypothetical protein
MTARSMDFRIVRLRLLQDCRATAVDYWAK